MPENLLLNPNIVQVQPSDAHETLLDSVPAFQDPDDLIFGLPLSIYNYQVTFSTPFPLMAGAQYWVGVIALMPMDAGFDWYRTVGTGGDNLSFQLSSFSTIKLDFDTVFTLYAADAHSAPEPRSFIFLAAGLIVCAVRIPSLGRQGGRA